ncbi:MAG: iron-only hydrogenase system regulator [Clostridia bacterium]|nr:iron-only hydrogenase system regulator [Clostridia bacterium]
MSEKRLAVISIIVEDREKSACINALLSEFGEFIVGRMGIPYKEKSVSVMCVIIDAPAEVINTLTGKLGMLSGVTAKTLMSKV